MDDVAVCVAFCVLHSSCGEKRFVGCEKGHNEIIMYEGRTKIGQF